VGERRWTRASLALLVAGAATQFGATGCESACDPPYVPVLAEGMYSTVPVPPSPNWPAGGTARPAPVPGFDTDGDGHDDTAGGSEDRLRLVVHRGSGDLTLAVAPPALVADPSADSVRAGDLDGDGRDDLVVTILDPSVPGPDGTPRMTTYLVSGTTPDGVHDPVDVGARPFGAEPLGSTQGVGDLDADGRDDLVHSVPAPETAAPAETRVWFGADLDLTPGGTSPVAPSRTLVGALGNTLALDGGRTALGLLSPVGAGDAVTWELTVWLPEGELRFAFPGSWPPYFSVELVDASDTTYLRVTWAYGRVGSRWAWDLHDLCAGAPPAAA
jgi:hypothetical protein